MTILLTLRDPDVLSGTEGNDPSSFSVRRAVRAVLTDTKERVALLHVGKWNYHKLPGGGVEDGEDLQFALQRELQEETGCRAEILKEIGEIIEYKNEHKEKQMSYCWLARQLGEANPPTFTDKELQNGFAISWAEDIDHATALFKQDQPEDYTGKFIRQRDLKLLEAAKALL
jgi:8-oxo-dGTP diphosphatase